MTPIFYHPSQFVDSEHISINKVSDFVQKANRVPRSDFEAATELKISKVHDPEFVSGIIKGSIKNGFGNTESAFVDVARYNVGNILAAARHVLHSEDMVACSASQGFHHAHYNSCYGYCTFNGLMLAAVMADVPCLIVDGDAHSGDGTDNIILELGLSLRVMNLDRPHLSRGVQPDWKTAMWRVFFRQWIREIDPGIILYQAGADAWCEDPFGSGYMTVENLQSRDRGLFIAAREAAIPLVWNLAGGYSERTVEIHLNTLRACDEVYYG